MRTNIYAYVDATVIAQFCCFEEACEWYDNLGEEVEIRHGDKLIKVKKADIIIGE